MDDSDTNVYSMTDVAPTVSAVLRLAVPTGASGSPLAPVVRALAGSARVAVIVPDGLGLYAWDLWQHEMPFLKALHAEHSLTLSSVMPSITPVNFATMVTGTDGTGHGVGSFQDDFACQTLFDVVREAGGKSAGIGLAGYTGSELLGRSADIWGKVEGGTDDDIAATILDIADGPKPEFLIAQLGRVDDVFHQHGPSSPSVVPMLRDTDLRLMRLVSHLAGLGYGILVLADHGHHDVDEPSLGLKGTHGTDSPEDCLVPFTWTSGRGPRRLSSSRDGLWAWY
jgi:predicted AlkP superfamily pyrophosphatase or phosphodiesterase